MAGDVRQLVEVPALEQLKGLGCSHMDGMRKRGSDAGVPEGVGI